MYESGDYNFGYRTGWVCPKCGHVYSPDYPWCVTCNSQKTYTTTSLNVDDFNNDLNEKLNELNKAKEQTSEPNWWEKWKPPYDFTCGIKNPYINKEGE